MFFGQQRDKSDLSARLTPAPYTTNLLNAYRLVNWGLKVDARFVLLFLGRGLYKTLHTSK